MDVLAMTRHLIGQIQELLEQQQQLYRWCFLNLDDNSVEDSHWNLMTNTGKSGKFKMLEPYNPSPHVKKPRKERDQAKLRHVTASLDQQIWKEFPDDLLEAVIARLPIAIFFRFRSVCQKWNSLLTSHSFSQQCAEVQQTQPWFYTNHDNVNRGAMYDPSLKRWHRPINPSLPTCALLFPVASAGALVCVADMVHRYLFVGNPVTRSFKELPLSRSVEIQSRVAVGMTLKGNSAKDGYKILWLRRDGKYLVYDSVKESWTNPRGIPLDMNLPLSSFCSQSVCIRHTLYFMLSYPEGIVSFDMESGVWKQFRIPLPVDLTNYALAECGGRIMLVGLLSKNSATCVCVWVLQKMMLLWREVDRMPNAWCLEFYGKHVMMACLGNKDLLVLSLRSGQTNRLVTYDAQSREWAKIPELVLPGRKKRQWLAFGTAFRPCLTALP